MATFTVDIPAIVHGFGVFTTLVGGVSCISTSDGDTSYMREHVALGSGVTSGFNDTISFPATAVPGNVSSVSLVTVTKGGDASHLPFFMLNKSGAGLAYWGTVFAGAAADWTELVTPLIWSGSEFVTQNMIEAGTVQYNPGYALLNGVWSGPIDLTFQWTYIALRVEYTRALNPPPCRIYPRDDNLTTGPGRILPTPRSQQASNRIIGGYN